MTPIRVAIALMLLGIVYGFLIGRGASPFILLVLPLVAVGFIKANA